VSTRAITALRSPFLPLAEAFLAECEKQGLDVLVVCTLRTLDEQAALYSQGRTTPGKIVTNAKPGSSAHNYGFAMDCCPLLNGKLIWGLPEGDAVSDPLWQQYGAIARQCGLEWGGNWAGFPEGPHVQLPNWRDHIPEGAT